MTLVISITTLKIIKIYSEKKKYNKANSTYYFTNIITICYFNNSSIFR